MLDDNKLFTIHKIFNVQILMQLPQSKTEKMFCMCYFMTMILLNITKLFIFLFIYYLNNKSFLMWLTLGSSIFYHISWMRTVSNEVKCL